MERLIVQGRRVHHLLHWQMALGVRRYINMFFAPLLLNHIIAPHYCTITWGAHHMVVFLGLGSSQVMVLVLENGFKKWKFWPPPNYMFLESWEKVLQGFILILGVKGHLRSLEDIKGQQLKILTPTILYVFENLRPSLKWICWNFWDRRSLEAIGGRWRLLEVNTKTFHNSWICWMCFSDDLCFVPRTGLSVQTLPINFIVQHLWCRW